MQHHLHFVEKRVDELEEGSMESKLVDNQNDPACCLAREFLVLRHDLTFLGCPGLPVCHRSGSHPAQTKRDVAARIWPLNRIDSS